MHFNDGTGRLIRANTTEDYYGSVSLGDIDGDGDVDILSTDYRENDGILLHRNDGHGSFTTSTPIFNSGGPTASVEFGDVDGDGDLDLFIARFGHHEVWLNDGLGNFTDTGQELFETGMDPQAFFQNLQFADLDGDQDLDVVVAPPGDFWIQSHGWAVL